MNTPQGGTGFRLQPAGRAYAKPMALLHGQCFPKAWSALEFEGFFEREGVFAALAYTPGSDHKPVGFILCWVMDEVCDLLSLGVLPDYRREGVGQLLLDYALLTANHMGAKAMMLEVNMRNEAAIAMYEENGFTRAGVRKAYYTANDGSKIDALQMRRVL
jgi:[ribosomal protein S18]-alanine N-acetyltransferase